MDFPLSAKTPSAGPTPNVGSHCWSEWVPLLGPSVGRVTTFPFRLPVADPRFELVCPSRDNFHPASRRLTSLN